MESMRKSKTFTAQSRSGWLVTFYNNSFSKHSILVLDGNSFGRIMGWDGHSNLVVHLPVKAWTDTSNAIWHWQAGISTHILPAPPCSKETAWWASPGRQGIQTWKQWKLQKMEIDHWKSKSTNKDRAFCWASMTALRAWLGCPSLNHQQSQHVWENIGTFANLYSNQKGSTILFLASKALLSKSSAWCGIRKVRACLDQKQCALSDAHETPGLLPNKTSTYKVTPMASVRHGNCGVKTREPHEPRLGGLWLKSQNGYWRS